MPRIEDNIGSATVRKKDGTDETFPVDIFNTEKFLYATRQLCAPIYGSEVARYRRLLLRLPPEKLRLKYMELGNRVNEFYEKEFPPYGHEESLITRLENWEWGINCLDQRAVDKYQNIYKEWIKISAVGKVLEDLLKKKKIGKDSEMKEIDKKGAEILQRLEMAILWLGGS